MNKQEKIKLVCKYLKLKDSYFELPVSIKFLFGNFKIAARPKFSYKTFLRIILELRDKRVITLKKKIGYKIGINFILIKINEKTLDNYIKRMDKLKQIKK